MAQLAQPVEPFGEVNVYRHSDGGIQVVATILMEPDIEGARTALALDGSASMMKMYGKGAVLGGAFARVAGNTPVNLVEPVARTMADYLARFSSTGSVAMAYWACNPDGTAVEPIGEISAEQAANLRVVGPTRYPWGRDTRLLPVLRYFVDDVLRSAPWAVCVFVTDGFIEDFQAVKDYSLQFARQIASGKRSFVKLVLLGVGDKVNAEQMEELDDMFEGSNLCDPRGRPIDLWDHKLAGEMRQLAEIFAEEVTEDLIVADHGRVLDDTGRTVRSYSDGVPALLRFTMPAESSAFTLELPGGKITQDIREGLARV